MSGQRRYAAPTLSMVSLDQIHWKQHARLRPRASHSPLTTHHSRLKTQDSRLKTQDFDETNTLTTFLSSAAAEPAAALPFLRAGQTVCLLAANEQDMQLLRCGARTRARLLSRIDLFQLRPDRIHHRGSLSA